MWHPLLLTYLDFISKTTNLRIYFYTSPYVCTLHNVIIESVYVQCFYKILNNKFTISTRKHNFYLKNLTHPVYIWIYVYVCRQRKRENREKQRQTENKHPGTIGLYARHVDRRRRYCATRSSTSPPLYRHSPALPVRLANYRAFAQEFHYFWSTNIVLFWIFLKIICFT